jgi:hypothetical protein
MVASIFLIPPYLTRLTRFGLGIEKKWKLGDYSSFQNFAFNSGSTNLQRLLDPLRLPSIRLSAV